MQIEEIIPYYYSKNPFLRWIFRKRLKIAVDLVDHKLRASKKLKVVDLGFGQGLLFNLLEKYPENVELFGVESEPNAKIVEKSTRAKITIADMRHTGFDNKYFDIVFSLDVIEHFKNLEEPIHEIKRIMKDDGYFVISIPTESFFYKLGRFLITGTTSMETAPCSPHYHKAKDIEKFLLENGFTQIKKVFLPPIPFLSLFHIILLKIE